MSPATALFPCRRYTALSEESSSKSSSHDDDSFTTPSSSKITEDFADHRSYSFSREAALHAIRDAASNLHKSRFIKNMNECLNLAEYLTYVHNDTKAFNGQISPSFAPSPTFTDKVAKWIANNDIEHIEVEVEPYEYAEYFEYNIGGKKKFRCGPICSLIMHRAYLILVPISLLLLVICGSILYLEFAPAKVEESDAQLTTTTSSTTSTVTPSTTTTTEIPSRCPPGGVWSEWTVTGSCPTTCGGCSVAPRVRQCTKECGECPCDGPSVDVGPCGLALCPFPSRTCCNNYRKSLNYQTHMFFCGTGNVKANQCAQ